MQVYHFYLIILCSVLEFTKAFNDFDQDGDGQLSVEELGVIMRSIGYNPSPKELQDMIAAGDKDGRIQY